MYKKWFKKNWIFYYYKSIAIDENRKLILLYIFLRKLFNLISCHIYRSENRFISIVYICILQIIWLKYVGKHFINKNILPCFSNFCKFE